MPVNFGMWRKAAWELIKLDDKKEWDALDVISKWLIATRSAVTAVTVYSSIIAGLMAWSIRQGIRQRNDALGVEMDSELAAQHMPFARAVVWLVIGLLLLVASSRLLVWGSVVIARQLGVDDLIIGLTIVAVGTSLPELASSLIAVRRREHDIALGNVLGSNLFNTLAVVGIAGTIHPLAVPPEVLTRDMAVMTGLTLLLFLFGYGFRGPGLGRINRFEGAILLAVYIGYTVYLISNIVKQSA